MKTLPVLLLLCATFARAEEQTQAEELATDTERKPLHTVVPAYPPKARRDRIEGDVQVCFHVDRKGRPYRIAVRSSSHRIFERAARRAVRESRYEPLPDNAALNAMKTCRRFQFRLESSAGQSA